MSLLPTPRRVRTLPALALVLTLGACADLTAPATPAAPGTRRADEGAALSGAATLPKPALVSSRIPYRTPRSSPATGRSGSGALTTRALLGRDGVTEVEVAVVNPDPWSWWNPGTLARVQTKGFDPDGKVIAVHNHNDLQVGSSAVFAYRGLARGAVVQVQGSVRGIDANRTDVVTVTDPVRLRPNLAVAQVAVPERVRKGARTSIAATIRETNGDVGATGVCVLRVDGRRTDFAEQVWVDAGDAVSCVFSHLFEREGPHQVQVTIESVSPRDDHAGDDTASVTTESVEVAGLFYAATATQTYFRDFRSWHERWWRTEVGSGEFRKDETWEGTEWTVVFDAWMPRSVAERPVRVEIAEENDGATVVAGGFAVELGEPSWDRTCGSGWDAGREAAVNVCVGSGETGYTSLSYARWAGSVTYHSREYSRQWDALTGEEWVYTVNGFHRNDHGARVAFGDEYALRVRLFDGDSVFPADPVMRMRISEHREGFPRLCEGYDSPEWGYGYEVCREYDVLWRARSGSTSG